MAGPTPMAVIERRSLEQAATMSFDVVSNAVSLALLQAH